MSSPAEHKRILRAMIAEGTLADDLRLMAHLASDSTAAEAASYIYDNADRFVEALRKIVEDDA